MGSTGEVPPAHGEAAALALVLEGMKVHAQPAQPAK